jgi:hypothetical protein
MTSRRYFGVICYLQQKAILREYLSIMHKVREYAIAIKRNHLTKYLNLKVVYKSI